MGALSLTNAALLAGLGMLALPILAHLLQRSTRRQIVFPSIRLLQETVAQQSQWQSVRRWLLLLLRLLAVACIVLAFTRPVWLDAGMSAPSSKSSVGVVLLLDSSLSTMQQPGGVSQFDALRAEASRLLDGLRPGEDAANLVIASASPRAVFPKLTRNVPALRTELAAAAPTDARADLGTALALSGKLLAGHSGVRKLVILSDFQRTNWEELLTSSRLADGLPEGVEVALVGESDTAPRNLALGNPRSFPSAPVRGQPVELSVQATNFSSAVQQVRLTMTLTDLSGDSPSAAAPVEQTVVLEPGAQRDVSFTTRLDGEGVHAAAFRLESQDDLAGDDVETLVLGAAPRLPVLVLGDDSPEEPGTASYFLMRALAPYDDLGRGESRGRYAPRHVAPRDLTAADLRGAAAVFAGYLGMLSRETATLLVEYVEQGGGLVLFCGDGPADRNLVLLDEIAGGQLAPWKFAGRFQIDRRDEPLHITAGRWQSRWFREFDERSQLAIAEISFEKVWNAGPPAPQAEVLLLFSDQRPALGARLVERGQFVLAGFSPEDSSGDLARHGAFVAIVQILAASLQGADVQAAAARVGEPLTLPVRLPAGAAYEARDPLGAAADLQTAVRGEGLLLTLPRPELAGCYEIRREGRTVAAAAIHVDPRESDLKSIPVDVLSRQFAAAGRKTIAGARETAADLNLSGQPLWGACFALAMLALGVELFLLGLWKR